MNGDIGFSVGDELGFPESLGNLEGSKRRSLNLKTGPSSAGLLPPSQMPVSVKIFVIKKCPLMGHDVKKKLLHMHLMKCQSLIQI